MSSRIGWPKRGPDFKPPTFNDGGSTTDTSGKNNRLSRASTQQPVTQPGTNMSINNYNSTNGVYGTQQSESTEGAPMLTQLDVEEYFKRIQDSARIEYDANKHQHQSGESSLKLIHKWKTLEIKIVSNNTWHQVLQVYH